MLRILASAVSVASKAGSEVRRILETGKLDVVDKGIQDFQTEADRTAQRLIVASLTRAFPKCTIVGEENLDVDEEADRKLLSTSFDEEVLAKVLPKEYEEVREEDITIWVDPLDGTAEFVKGHLDHVTVLIGFSLRGKAVAGVVHQPFYNYTSGLQNLTGRTMWGLVGFGCFGVSPKPMPDGKLIVTTTASHNNKDIDESIAALKPDEVLRVGGAGHKVLLVIEGSAHAYVFASSGSKRWDTCAPEALLKSLGGQLTDITGKEIEYSHRLDGNYQNYMGIIASANRDLHSRIIRDIPQDVVDRLANANNDGLRSKI